MWRVRHTKGYSRMYLKITEKEGKKIIAVCDTELLGQVFEEGGVVLDLKMYERFYKGEEATAEEVARALADFDSANLVGKEAVGIAIERGLAEEEDVKYIKNIPHLQLYRI